jgi:rfaE bifunctional protein kinase chain/domain
MSPAALTTEVVERVLEAAGRLTIGVLGDLYLDRYLDIDATLTEPSIETGLDAYQVVRVRSIPGAAGTVINNLVALGVEAVIPLSVIGRDGEGRELLAALEAMSAVWLTRLIERADLRTPTYTKPMLQVPGQPARELNRLDIHNRSALPDDAEAQLIDAIEQQWPDLHGLVVLDQVSLPDCGVVTARVRERLAGLAAGSPEMPVLADSRARIGLFRGVSLKPNVGECMRATGLADDGAAATELARRAGRAVFCTRGAEGILISEPDGQTSVVPGYPVTGPIDPVGAGDSTSAGIICALAAGATRQHAAAFGNLVASITVQKLGTTGTATPDEVRQRWREVSAGT